MEKERIIKDRLQRLIKGIKKADWKDCDPEYMARLAEERINELQKRGVYCVDKFVQRLVDSVSIKEAYLDILMEGRFAIVLARNNFSGIQIEFSKEGPDLKANYNRCTVYFEVTRKNPNEQDKELTQSGVAWQDPQKTKTIIRKIREKLNQLQSDELNIVVLWSDTIRLLLPNMKQAWEDIQQRIYRNPQKYKDLSAILFAPGGFVNSATLKQFYPFKNPKASKPLGPRLFNKLDSLHEKNPKQLQREFEELAAAVQRLRSFNPTTP